MKICTSLEKGILLKSRNRGFMINVLIVQPTKTSGGTGAIQADSVLFSLLLVSSEVKCDASLFNTIRNRPVRRGSQQSAGARYFFLGVGYKEGRSGKASTDMVSYRRFQLPRRTLANEFGGKKPKLCVTTQKMTPKTGRNRVKILTFMFNFILNSDKLQRRSLKELNTSGNQECRSRSSTLEML